MLNVVVKIDKCISVIQCNEIFKILTIRKYSNGSIVYMKNSDSWLDYSNVPYFEITRLNQQILEMPDNIRRYIKVSMCYK